MKDMRDMKIEIFIKAEISSFSMKRKLIKQGGGGGLTFYVPKKWADKRRLKAGDEINIEETEEDLLVSSTAKKRLKKIEIEIEKEDKLRIRTIISSAYRRGYDQVTLKSKYGFSFVEINQIIDSLIGYVITEQDDNKIIIKNIMADDFEDVSAILNKLLITIKFFISAVIEYLESSNKDKSELSELMKSIMKSRDYCQRMIHLTTYAGDKCYEYNTLVFIAEKIAGNFNDLLHLKLKKRNLIVELKKRYDLFSKLYTALMKKNINMAIKLNDNLSKLKINLKGEIPIIGVITENLFSLSSRIIGILI